MITHGMCLLLTWNVLTTEEPSSAVVVRVASSKIAREVAVAIDHDVRPKFQHSSRALEASSSAR